MLNNAYKHSELKYYRFIFVTSIFVHLLQFQLEAVLHTLKSFLLPHFNVCLSQILPGWEEVRSTLETTPCSNLSSPLITYMSDVSLWAAASTNADQISYMSLFCVHCVQPPTPPHPFMPIFTPHDISLPVLHYLPQSVSVWTPCQSHQIRSAAATRTLPSSSTSKASFFAWRRLLLVWPLLLRLSL